jgi:hypothetical protein
MGYMDPFELRIFAALADDTLSPAATLSRLNALQKEIEAAAIAENAAKDCADDSTPGLSDTLYSIWTSLLDIAQDEPAQQDRLLDTIGEMQKSTDGEGWTVSKELASWSRLTLLGQVVRDLLNGTLPRSVRLLPHTHRSS